MTVVTTEPPNTVVVNADGSVSVLSVGAQGPQGIQGPAGPMPSLPGSDKQVLFNDGGVFGAAAGLVFDKTTDVLTISGRVLVGDGTVAAPSLAFASETTLGLFRRGTAALGYAQGGSQKLEFSGDSIQLPSTGTIRWLPGSSFGVGADLFLQRDVANVLAQRNGANAQAFRVYNTYTDASNYERLTFSAAPTGSLIRQEQAGTGAARELKVGTTGLNELYFDTNSVTRFFIHRTGYMACGVDNTYDIGQPGALRPRDIHIGRDLRTAGRTHVSVVATASLPAAGAAEDGRILIEDNGTGDRNLVVYAGGQRFRIDGGAAF